MQGYTEGVITAARRVKNMLRRPGEVNEEFPRDVQFA